MEPYKTSDTPFAAYLHLKGMVLLDTIPDKADPNREIFVFVDDENRPQYESDYRNGTDLVSARDYYLAHKYVLRHIKKIKK